MDFDANSLLASLFIGGIGFVLLAYGKKQERLPHMIAGAALLAYPYFVTNVFLMSGIAILVLAGLWAVVRFARW